MKTEALRWIAPGILTVFFIFLLFFAENQRSRSWTEFNKTLETSLLLEGRARVLLLSDRLDPFYSDWGNPRNVPYLPEWTGASWLLFNATGEIEVDLNGDPLYAEPLSASDEVDWREDALCFGSAIAGEECVSAFARLAGKYRLRAFFPVAIASGAISTKWVLVGQVGEGSGDDSYFAQIYKAQRQFWLTAIPLSLASLLFLILLFRGIVRTNRLESALREAEESIELESLTSTLAHELRNPLSIIQSCAELLGKQENLSAEGQELVEDLISEVGRSQDVLSRHLHPERYQVYEIDDLETFCKDFWEHRQSLLQTQNTSLELGLPTSASPLAVIANPEQLEKILDNLLRNSLEAMDSYNEDARSASLQRIERKIYFEMEPQEQSVILRFRDTGPGFKFGSFTTRDGWKYGSAKPEGKGLGLRLANKWLRKWEGSLTARNQRQSYWRRIHGTEIVIQLRRVLSS